MLVTLSDAWFAALYAMRKIRSRMLRLSKTTQKLDLGRTVPYSFRDAGSHLVRIEGLASGADAVLRWEPGNPIRSACGREVCRLVVHSDEGLQMLFSEPAIMMDLLVNAPFSIVRISGISLVFFDCATSSAEIVDFKGFVAWPPVHLPSAV